MQKKQYLKRILFITCLQNPEKEPSQLVLW